MNIIYKGIHTLVVIAMLSVGVSFAAMQAQAAGVNAHVRIVGTDKTIWYGDVTVDSCTVKDTDGKDHAFTQPAGICALDAASKKGNFTYKVKDFGSNGLFVESIASDAGAEDFSTFWLYDVNGKAATVGISSYVVANNDNVYFHFENPAGDANKRAINDGLAYLKSQQDTTGKIAGFGGVTSWAAMTFAAAGINPGTVSNGGATLMQYIAANPPAANAGATDWERDVLAITAAGQNPYTYNDVDYVAKIATYHNNNQIGSATQVNDDMFGLLALVSAGNGASKEIKEDALQFIISKQATDGGFSWSTTGITGVDDTASALQAMVAAQKAGLTATGLSTSITNAKSYILVAQNSDGGFPYVKQEASNASSTAWALMALNSLGQTGTEVDKAKAYLRASQDENGSFRWQTGSTGETFTTAYAVHALTGKYWPVKVFASSIPTVIPTTTPSATTSPTLSPTVIPTVTKVPTITPKPTGTPGNQGPVSSFRERMKQFQAEQKRIVAQLRENVRKLIASIKANWF